MQPEDFIDTCHMQFFIAYRSFVLLLERHSVCLKNILQKVLTYILIFSMLYVQDQAA